MKKMIEERGKRLFEWIDGKKAPPETVEIFPTIKCNSRCRFCPRYNIEKTEIGKELTEDRLLSIIEECSQLGVFKIDVVGGGEPLFRFNTTVKMMNKIKELGMYGYLNTNGTLFTEELIKHLVLIGWDYIKFSIHGPNAETHDYLTRIHGSFSKLVNALELFKFWKTKLKSSKPRIEFGPVLCNKNFDKLAEMTELAKKLGVEEFRPQPFINYPNIVENVKLNEKEEEILKLEISHAKKLAEKYQILTNFDSLIETDIVKRTDRTDEIIKTNVDHQNPFLSAPCYEPWLHITIWPDGNLAPCSFPGNEFRIPLGESLRDIWYGEYFEKLRGKMLRSDLAEYCSRCVAGVIFGNLELKRIINDKISRKVEE